MPFTVAGVSLFAVMNPTGFLTSAIAELKVAIMEEDVMPDPVMPPDGVEGGGGGGGAVGPDILVSEETSFWLTFAELPRRASPRRDVSASGERTTALSTSAGPLNITS